MIFSTPPFLFLFLPLVLLAGFLLRPKAQNLFLLMASLVFYAWGEGGFVLLLLGSASCNHFFGLGIEKAVSAKKKKTVLLAALGFNLSLLIVFKYARFILANLEPLLRAAGLPVVPGPAWHQPLGISFFTFMAIAYLVEVYNNAIPAERNFLHTALFISFFPTVLAGPINRYSRLRQRLTERETTPEALEAGVRRFIIGLGKKVLLADTLARAVDPIFAIPGAGLTASLAWLGAFCYLLQIYLDFSGYTDMAIGLGRMFGFDFMENFNFPYLSKSINDFWTRWHISLSTWLRDFLFLPLAYAISRRIRTDRLLGIRADFWSYYPAMLLTMLLCGLWHGAAWTFVAWGLYHGAFIMLERSALKKFLRRLGQPLQTAYALLVVTMGWVLFRSPDFSSAVSFWRSMFGFGRGDGKEFYPALYLNPKLVFFMVIGAMVAFKAFPWQWDRPPIKGMGTSRPWLRTSCRALAIVFLVGVLLACAMAMAVATYNPFIYFRF
jgi:alginate O-acetyltransferase complex protein AlgI